MPDLLKRLSAADTHKSNALMFTFKGVPILALLTGALMFAGPVWANAAGSAPISVASTTDMPINLIVQDKLFPQLDYFFKKLSTEKEQVTIDGVLAFKGKDKFLPGKIAIGLGHLLLSVSPGDKNFGRYIQGYGDIADLTVNMDNDSWGIYYYVLAIHKLERAGLLERAISPATLAILKQKLDWRKFVTQTDYTLIDLPSNYYGVAFSIARLRMLLGWEDETASMALLDKTLKHYETYSGKYGFSDETDGDGRFDRYSILLIAEICQRFIETGLTVTPELKGLLRKSADIALNIGNTAGEGFSFGRSIGAYADTSILEILSVSAYLDILSPEEKQYAYSYAARIVANYADFWYDPAIQSVNLWGKGRRTDAYRGRHRILGENFSLLHQLISTNALWNKAGFVNKLPKTDLQAWLDKTQPPFSLTWFARGEHDRALAIFRDKQHVFSLLMVNGGAGQHANSPYYPLPFSNAIVAGVADSGYRHPQLLPKFTLADGTQLIATAFIKNIHAEKRAGKHVVTYQQDGLTRLGMNVPLKDARIKLETEYSLEPGVITRTDKYTPLASLDVESVTLDFATFSDDATQEENSVSFKRGAVSGFEVSGMANCKSENTRGSDEFKSPRGPMKTRVICNLSRFRMIDPLVIKWVLKYR